MITTEFKKFEEIRDGLLSHPLYKDMDHPEKIKVFMKHHVFAVWDFMSLLKRLQQSVTSVSVPWMPYETPAYSRFINEIVLGEESDEDGQGGYASHFQLYLEAMREAGADTEPIEQFIEKVKSGVPYEEALQQKNIPLTVQNFVLYNLELAGNGKTHEVAAAFFYGREDLIPDMFQSLLDALKAEGTSNARLEYYLKRHIELDGDEHGPLAERLLRDLCGGDAKKEQEAINVAQKSLRVRSVLWDGVLEEIRNKGL
ncbi:DUF3050 domain-containing protein [Ammoniphilus sp. CFH 90114]|uniref:DUF3050 domain-containing protein n=1 Tax=Ammoniphilus sp. CFH 90114 TaxID=2493665 RepID=UPI00100EDD50|nr:DUF3050 domain-containing protein [Ammoniphilus sp. CFH 90114]RXT04884.1 DUF3050 domain-containing protein [Ammoniphilus sp. CFH 90114]